MPTPRKDVSQLGELTLKRNTGRYEGRGDAPEPGDVLGAAPEYLTVAERSIWDELVSLVPAGVLFACDQFILELTVQLTGKLRERTLRTSEVGQLRACLACLGITPGDRSRVRVVPKPEESLLDRILAGEGEPDDV